MGNNKGLSALAALGFSETEAAVYCELLRQPATGYRLAQAIGKSPPNIYLALGSLHQKGAVLADDSEGRVYRAAAPAELLGALERQFEARRSEALGALSTIGSEKEDDRIYHLKTLDQTYARARAMVAGARETLLFDCFPAPFEALREDLRAAAGRGVRVAGIVYDEATEASFDLVRSPPRPGIIDRWPGDQLSIVADACEYLLALLARDGRTVRHAVWSNGAYLSTLQHNALASEIRLYEIAPEDRDRLAGLALLRADPPGLRKLVEGAAGEAEKTRRDAG
ncbi:MAG TPA: helix-turn-helix domain-containing protein [Allosphingosinicella sp.]|nr:helix-turn-helix domain-containing protein [Allosphingosinicella sp.]